MAKRSQGATNRNKGHVAEREYAKMFREELGFEYCQTARRASRIMDDSGIDLVNIPFNVQIKAGKHAGMNSSKVLSIIKERLPDNFPLDNPVHNYPSILIHRKEALDKAKRTEFDTLVTMTLEDFKKIIINGKSK